jgi:hypothetical protein
MAWVYPTRMFMAWLCSTSMWNVLNIFRNSNNRTRSIIGIIVTLNQFAKALDIEEHDRREGDIFCVLGCCQASEKFREGRAKDTDPRPNGE